MEGLTGRVKFDQAGRRSQFTLEIVELKKHGVEQVRKCVLPLLLQEGK